MGVHKVGRTYMVMLWITISWIHSCLGHPQCLDFRPPFQPQEGLKFCKEYSDYGCCTAADDRVLEERHRALLAAQPANSGPACNGTLQQVLCLQCSPYAAHVFDSEVDGVAAPIPGLCTSFCGTFYDSCQSLIPMMAGEKQASFQSLTKSAFCEKIRIGDVDYCYPDLLTNNIFNQDLNRTSSTKEGCLCLEEFASGLRNALSFEVPPDGSGRIFVSEQIGQIHIYFKNGTKIKQPFMDLTDEVLTSAWKGDERGFLGLTFHPNFMENNKFYCYFSVMHEGQQKIQISEYLISTHNPNKVNVTYEKILLQVVQPQWNHNGGEILFGIDGYLYLFLGDGGGAGDPGDRAQNKGVLLGKVLRIDVDVPSNSTEPYRIPSDNPFVGEEGSRPEIFAYGIRNIWRCDLDEGDPITGYGRGRIICGDVGQSAYEEVDLIEKGGNYGWNSREGFECFKQSICGKIGEEVLPIHAYPHSVGKSVTGGHVYRGCLNPALNGVYIFGDFVNGKLFKLEETSAGQPWSSQQIQMCGTDVCFNGLVNEYEQNILSFGEDDDGEIYMLTTTDPITTQPSGKIYKIVDPRRRGDPSTCRSEIARLAAQTTTTQTTTTPVSTSVTTNTDNQQVIPTTGRATVPRPGLFTAYLAVTTCVMLPVISCVTYRI